MKKILLLFCIITFLFAMPAGYCRQDGPVFEDKPSKIETFKETITNKLKNIKNIFSNKKTKEETVGYYGTLPDIDREFSYKRDANPLTKGKNTTTLDEADRKNFKDAPFDDPLFLDVVVKKQKDSAYINDVQRTKNAIISLKNCIETKGDLQRFNGCVNLIDLYVRNLKGKYQNTEDAYRTSYREILTLNYHAKVLGNLKYDANYYARYVPTQEGQYSKANINAQEKNLLKNIEKTLTEINSET